MVSREGKHRIVYFEFDGKRVVKTMRSHGDGDLGNVEFAIRKQLNVDAKQLRALADCPMTRDAYVENLRTRGVIESEPKG